MNSALCDCVFCYKKAIFNKRRNRNILRLQNKFRRKIHNLYSCKKMSKNGCVKVRFVLTYCQM